MTRKSEWTGRAGKALMLAIGAMAFVTLLSGCPTPEESEPPAPEEEPIQPPG